VAIKNIMIDIVYVEYLFLIIQIIEAEVDNFEIVVEVNWYKFLDFFVIDR